MVAMVKVGESKYDNYGRITCSVKIAELLELIKGEDIVEWHVTNGEVVLKKRTRSYYGLDIEAEEIKERLIAYEDKYVVVGAEQEFDPEERIRKAREEYEIDRKSRLEKLQKERK